MGMTNCKECKNQVSDKAKSCPACGAPVKPASSPMRGCLMLCLLGLLGFIYCTAQVSDSVKEGQQKEEARKAERTPKQIRDENISSLFFRDGSCQMIKKHVVSNLKDPDSFKHVETIRVIKEDKILVAMKYRAKNSFNAYVIENVAAEIKIKPNGEVISYSMLDESQLNEALKN